MFTAYTAAGYDPSEVTISLVNYCSGSQAVGAFKLNQVAEFTAALQGIQAAGPGGWKRMDLGLDAVGDAWSSANVDPNDTNIVVFMSDGDALPTDQDIAGAVQNLEDNFGALITGVGIGSNSSLDDLNELANTGGASQVLSGQDITVTVEAFFEEVPCYPGSGAQVVTTVHVIALVICFTPGSMILTPKGEVAIETFLTGDRVLTRDQGVRKFAGLAQPSCPLCIWISTKICILSRSNKALWARIFRPKTCAFHASMVF